jgi:hypothetical protein
LPSREQLSRNLDFQASQAGVFIVLGGEGKENSRRIDWLELLVPEHIVHVFHQGCQFAGISLIQKIAHQSAKFLREGS